jgi:hypothetical protein
VIVRTQPEEIDGSAVKGEVRSQLFLHLRSPFALFLSFLIDVYLLNWSSITIANELLWHSLYVVVTDEQVIS